MKKVAAIITTGMLVALLAFPLQGYASPHRLHMMHSTFRTCMTHVLSTCEQYCPRYQLGDCPLGQACQIPQDCPRFNDEAVPQDCPRFNDEAVPQDCPRFNDEEDSTPAYGRGYGHHGGCANTGAYAGASGRHHGCNRW